MARLNSYEKRVAIIGGTFAGNKGAASMLESVIINLNYLFCGRIKFDVISIYPKRDSLRQLHEQVRIIPAKPVKLLLMLTPFAMLYLVLKRLHLPRKFLLSFKLLQSIVRADVLLDVSGISYVDGRGATLLYNIACNLPSIIVGTPLVKLSQALGPFKGYWNRKAARFVLPRVNMIFARGQQTEDYLKELNLSNVSPASDLAFILNKHALISEIQESQYSKLARSNLVIGISPSKVLESYCEKRGKDLVNILQTFLNRLQELSGAHILIIAHSLLDPENHSRNNDYHICISLYNELKNKENVTLVLDDLTPSEIRGLIAQCTCFIACRFHSMISALCVEVPTLVIAWSHKYKEVMSGLGLNNYVLGFDEISPDSLLYDVHKLLDSANDIQNMIKNRLPEMKYSSQIQIDYVANLLNGIDANINVSNRAKKLYQQFYKGHFRNVFLGYSSSRMVREGAASGGLVTSILINQLRSGNVTGAIESLTTVENGRLEFRTTICTTEDEVLACQTSIYSDFNHAKNVINILQKEEGVFAVVALPCQWKRINSFIAKHPKYSNKIGLRVGLWCGHATDRRLMDDFLDLKGIDQKEIEKFFYRRGFWRGETIIEYTSGEKKKIPFSTGFGLFQNLYIDCMFRCFSCTDHFGEESDVSFGDAWLKRLKDSNVKHSMVVAFSDRGLGAIDALRSEEDACISETVPELAVQSQKRAVIWHTFSNAGRSKVAPLFGLHIANRSGVKPRWNDFLSAFFIFTAYRVYKTPLRSLFLKLPWPIPYAYMLVQKFFLNF